MISLTPSLTHSARLFLPDGAIAKRQQRRDHESGNGNGGGERHAQHFTDKAMGKRQWINFIMYN